MHSLIALGTLVLALSLQPSASSQGTAFTYQGRLNDGRSPANGIYDLRSSIYDAVTAGSQVGATTTNAATAVSNGLLTVVLDFGPSVFDGSARWLELAVRTNGGGAFTTLSPRQALTPAPYAIAASNLTGFLPASKLIGSIPAGQLLGSYSNAVSFNNATNMFAGSFSGNGSGLTNVAGTLAWQLVLGTNVQAVPNTGYILTNPQPVTVSLPGSPNVGDIVRVSATGAGGWRISQNPSQRIINSYGFGDTWRVTSAPQGQWVPLASSADGMKLVAAMALGQIWTSTDAGATWTMQTAVARDWNALASSADGTRLVASVSGGRIWVSTNSGNTFVTTSAPTTNWTCLASSANGSNLVAGVASGQIFVSSDAGDSWTPHGPIHLWGALASSTDGVRLIASGDFGVFTSANSGISWTSRPLGTGADTAGVASSGDGTRLAVATGGVNGQGFIYISTDSGVTWAACGSSQNWVEITMSADGTKLAAATFPGQIWTSTDSGANWAPHGPATSWYRIVSSADGSRLVADNAAYIWTSQSTTTLGAAGYLTGGQNSAIEIQYLGGGVFIPLSHEGNISQF